MDSKAGRRSPGWRTFLLPGASTIPLLLGGVIYLLWRDTSLLMFLWLEELGLSEAIANARSSSLLQATRPPAWVVFSLPNALWVLALVSSAGLLWRGTRRPWLKIAVTIAACFGVGAEVAQGLGVLPGTFSITDVALAATGAAIGGAFSFAGESYAT